MSNPTIDRARAAWRFLKLGLSDFDTTASLVPSSRFLVEAMLRPAQLAFARMPADSVLYGLELDGKLLEATAKRVNDPRLRPVHGSAADVRELIDAVDAGQIDAVISSLGLSLMDEEVRAGIVRGAGSVLKPDGVYTQYAYLHARWFAYSQSRKLWFRWRARPFLERHYGTVQGELVAANVPPAVAYTCRDPK
jgi:phosphatidylethanolamine/phosphatidyl-N-methylethanolamine N-methyltransferase